MAKLNLKGTIANGNLHYILPFLAIVNHVCSQEKIRLKGIVSDAENNVPLESVLIVQKKAGVATRTNTHGFYQLELPPGPNTVTFRLDKYKEHEETVHLRKNTVLDVRLIPVALRLRSRRVRWKKGNENIRNTEMSLERFRIEELNRIPVIMGEKDIMKTIQLVPGITTITEGRSAFITRGSGIDQNAIFFDGMPIYYTSHMSGLYSIFNSESVDKLTVYKGGIPARYGGRTASVLDVTMIESDPKRYHAAAGIGLITSKAAIQAPVIRDRLSLFATGRSTKMSIGRWIDNNRKGSGTIKGKNLYNKKSGENDGPIFFPSGNFFYDMNGKAVFKLNENNRFSLSGFTGHDDEWSIGHWFIHNDAASFQWDRTWNADLLANTTLYYSKYATKNLSGGWVFNSWIQVRGLKHKLTWAPDKSNTVSAGFSSEYQDFNHGGLTDKEADTGGKFMPPMQGFESALFVENEQKLSYRLAAYYGLRYSTYHQVGPGDNVYYNKTNDPVDRVYHENFWDVMTFHHSLEPRLSFSCMLSAANSIKATYNRTAQYVRLMTNSMQLQYYDIWLPATHNIEPMRADQVAIGYFHNFLDNRLKFSAETYYKWARDDADFEDGLHNYFVNNLEAFVATGKGRSYGLELIMKKPKGRATGWVSYNLSRSNIQIDAVNNGRWYTSKFDKSHDFTFVTNVKILGGFSLSANWVYATGNAVTLPEAMYEIQGVIVPYYEGRNKYRLPDYHRLDLGLIVDTPLMRTVFKRYDRSLNTSLELSFYNVYDRRNVNAIGFSGGKGTRDKIEPFGTSLYGFMPTFLVNIEF